MKKILWVSMLLLVVMLITPLACKAPAEFELASLRVAPPEVTLGETVSITAQVKNTGGTEGVYPAILTIDGAEVERKDVAVAPGASETVTFSLVKREAGTYQVAVGELSSSVTVKALAEFELISLGITPPEITAGEIVSIIAQVKNTGGTEGVYTAILTVDGAEVERKDIAVAPGATETVAFSLVKHEAGTYQVAIGELSSSLTVKEKPVIEPIVKEIELKYDDGTAGDCISTVSPSFGGHIVDFSPPATPFTIKKIRIFGVLSGKGWEDRKFDVEILDKDLKVVYSATYPYTKFTNAPTWVEVEVPDIKVADKFYVHVYTNSPYPGLHIGADDSVVNEHSDVTTRTAEGTVAILAQWPYSPSIWFGDKSKVNWMIRVVGTFIES